MRFAVAALLFVVSIFIFFVSYAVFTYMIDILYTALSPTAHTEAITDMDLLKNSFGIICGFVLALLFLIFGMDSLSEEPEMYWTEGDDY